MRTAGAALAAAAMIASCAPRPTPPAPTPPPPRPASPAPLPPPAPPPVAWQDGPLSPGDWSYGSDAEAGRPGAGFASDREHFSLRCERNGTIMIGVSGPQPPFITIATSYGERRLPATPVHSEGVLTTLPAADPLFDQMAFSRGRFLVHSEGAAALVIPAWPELARVVEDCRG